MDGAAGSEVRSADAEGILRAAERRAQELVLREAGVREQERLHGVLEERERRVAAAEEQIEKAEAELEHRRQRLAAADERVAAKHSEYERLVSPLAQREALCLQREAELRALHAAAKAEVVAETRRARQAADAAKQREDEAKHTQAAAGEARCRAQKKEAEAAALKEELLAELRQHKQKSDEVEQRGRAVEWKEKEVEAEVQKALGRDAVHQAACDALEKQREELLEKDAALAKAAAEVEEDRLALQQKVQKVLEAAAETSCEALDIARMRARLEEMREEIHKRSKAVEDAELSVDRERSSLTSLHDRLAEQEDLLSEKDKDIHLRERAVRDAERDLLRWMQETAWRESAVERVVAHPDFQMLFPSRPRLGEAPATDIPGAGETSGLVAFQLASAKNKYLGTVSKRLVSSDRGERACSRSAKDVFRVSFEEAKDIKQKEQQCRTDADRLARYLSRHRFIDEKLEELPLPVGTVDDNLLENLTREEQEVLQRVLRRERELASELKFQKMMHDSPLVKRRNTQSAVEVLQNFERWYTEAKRLLHARYKDILTERASNLTAAVCIFEARCGKPPQPPTAALTFPLHAVKPKPEESRYRTLAGSLSRGGTASSPVSKKRERKDKDTRPTAIDQALWGAGVKSHSRTPCLKHYYNAVTEGDVVEQQGWFDTLEFVAPGGSGGSESRPPSRSTSLLPPVAPSSLPPAPRYV